MDAPNQIPRPAQNLPLATLKVTDFETIQQYLSYFQRVAKNVEMPYVNVALDDEAAMNALRTFETIQRNKKRYQSLGKLSLSQRKFPSKSFCLTVEESIYTFRSKILFLKVVYQP